MLMIDHCIQHRGNQVGDRHPFFLERPHGRLGMEEWHENMLAAGPGNGKGCPGISQMKHRRHMRPDIGIGQTEFGDGR